MIVIRILYLLNPSRQRKHHPFLFHQTKLTTDLNSGDEHLCVQR